MPSATSEQHAQRKAFGMRVRELRQSAGLSQEQLAHQAGLDRSYVGQVERGERNVSLDNIHRLAEALGVSPGALL
ncbi:helix-turn-helix domain-containing protein [Microbacterium laevaniformans]|nr:helix-turn-helix transcriptional regulator [Microbacterium laevaniformans]